MSDNVIALRSRKPLKQTIEQEKEDENKGKEDFIKIQLQIIDNIRKQIEEGNIENFLFVSHSPNTGMFMHEILFKEGFARSGLAFGFLGMLESIKLEITEVAQMAPTMSCTGEIVSAFYSEEDPEEE